MMFKRQTILPKRVFGVYYGLEAIGILSVFILTFVYTQRLFGDSTIILQFNLYEYEVIERATQLRRFFLVGLGIVLMNAILALLIIHKQVFSTKVTQFVSNWLHISTIGILVFILLHLYYIISINT
jgi:hypothetical protein